MACCANFTLFLISFLSIGVIVAGASFTIYFIVHYKIKEITDNNTILIYIIIILVASAFILVFAIYASIANARCPSFILGFILLVYAAAVIGAIVLYIMFNSKVWDTMRENWNNYEGKNDTAIGKAIEEIEGVLHCKHWDDSNGSCKTLIEDKVKKFAIAIYVVFGLIALLLLFASGLAFYKVCRSDSTISNDSKAPMEQPLSYGW